MPPLTMPSLNHPYQAFHALQAGKNNSMQVYQTLDGLALHNTVVALGMFDGLHQGHQTILRKTVAVAQAIQATPVVLSFANHPQMVLSQTPPTLLSDLSQRLALFERFGLQVAVVPTFTADWKLISAQDFVSQILMAHLGARAVVSGYDYRFGANRQGDTQMLKDFGQRQGFETQVIEPVQVQGQIVSSTLIRKLLNYGDIATANALLGYPYALAAHVVPGSSRGQALGFPTANLAPDANRLLPATGTYCGYAVLDDAVYKAVWNIGTNPTFTADNVELPPRRLEVHLLGYTGGDLYGRALRIHFMHRLRDETRFASVDALKAQIQADCDKATWALPTVMDAGGPMALTQTFTKRAKTTQLAVQVTLKRRIRSATARHRDGAIWVTVPSHWSKKLQQEAIDTLVGRLRDQNQANCTLAFESRQSERCLTFDNAADLAWWVHDLNQATLKAPISGIRVGTAKFTRLACMNVRTRLMTISRFSLIDVPEAALRYLVLHELAHCFVANHSKAFWAQVARFCLDYRHQARVMQAVHHVNVDDIQDATLPVGLMMSRLVLFGPQGPQVKALKPPKTSAVAPMAPSYTNTAPKRRAAAAAKDKDTVQLSLFEA